MKKKLVAMLLAVGLIASMTGCGSKETTPTTNTTEEAVTEEAQTEEVVEEVVEETTVEEAVEEITVDELTVKVREAMEATPYVVSDYTVIINGGTDNNYNSYYNKELDTIYYSEEGNLPFWVDVNSSTLYALDENTNEYLFYTSQDDTNSTEVRALNIHSIYKTEEDSSAVCTLDSIVNNIATVTISNTLEDGNNYIAVVTINTETSLIESYHYTELTSDNVVVRESELELSYPAEGTPEYDEFIQKATIPAEAIEAANNQ